MRFMVPHARPIAVGINFQIVGFAFFQNLHLMNSPEPFGCSRSFDSDLDPGLQQDAVVNQETSNSVPALRSLPTFGAASSLKVGYTFRHRAPALDADLGFLALFPKQAGSDDLVRVEFERGAELSKQFEPRFILVGLHARLLAQSSVPGLDRIVLFKRFIYRSHRYFRAARDSIGRLCASMKFTREDRTSARAL